MPPREHLATAVFWALATLALTICAPVAAQTLRVLQPVALRAERSAEAASVASLAAGQGVSLLHMSGGWAQVQVPGGPSRGWVRASQLDLGGAEVASASQLETGRRAPGATAVTMGVRAVPGRKARHALIVGVGSYQTDAARPAPALPGVPHDMVNALAMAQLLRVPPAHMAVLRDAAATREGVQQALRELAARMKPGDSVFVYWAGHGSCVPLASGTGCTDTLVPHDLRDISSREWAQWMQPVASQAEQMLVIVDASRWRHAATPPALKPPGAGWSARYVAASELRGRGLTPERDQERSLSEAVYAQVSSSRTDELSLEHAGTGGLATAALRECMQRDARDADGSGAISVEELAACAQAKVALRIAEPPGLHAQHLVVSGSRGLVPDWFASKP